MTRSLGFGVRNAAMVVTVSAALWAAACSSDDSKGKQGSGLDTATGGSAGITADQDTEPTADDFTCLKDGTKVKGFYVKNRFGTTADAEAIAGDANGGTYPTGTVIQLIPGEAMVKRYAGYSPETNDWEFFSLNVTAAGTEIATKGTTDVLNAFNLNCFDCHKKAEAQFDLVCGKDHGCDPLPFTDDQIASIVDGDARCGK